MDFVGALLPSLLSPVLVQVLDDSVSSSVVTSSLLPELFHHRCLSNLQFIIVPMTIYFSTCSYCTRKPRYWYLQKPSLPHQSLQFISPILEHNLGKHLQVHMHFTLTFTFLLELRLVPETNENKTVAQVRLESSR